MNHKEMYLMKSARFYNSNSSGHDLLQYKVTKLVIPRSSINQHFSNQSQNGENPIFLAICLNIYFV